MNYEFNAITFEQVSYRKNDDTIINKITGSFKKEQITAIVGPSGAGKTTVLKLCNGLKEATSGNIYIHGKLINSYPPQKLRRLVGIAFQDAPMIHGSARDNLALPLTLKKQMLTKEKAELYLNEVSLQASILKKDVRDLSGGERQRLSLARTLLNEPNILLLDEITASLDQVATKEIEKLLLTINERRKTTIIWITHDLEQAKRVANRVWVLMKGRLYEEGTIAVLEQPKHPEVKQFIQGDNK